MKPLEEPACRRLTRRARRPETYRRQAGSYSAIGRANDSIGGHGTCPTPRSPRTSVAASAHPVLAFPPVNSETLPTQRYPMTRLLLTAAFAVATAMTANPATFAQDTSTAARSEVTTERFRDWALRCQSEGDRRQCSIFQRLVVQETNQVALNLVIGFGQD